MTSKVAGLKLAEAMRSSVEYEWVGERGRNRTFNLLIKSYGRVGGKSVSVRL